MFLEDLFSPVNILFQGLPDLDGFRYFLMVFDIFGYNWVAAVLPKEGLMMGTEKCEFSSACSRELSES